MRLKTDFEQMGHTRGLMGLHISSPDNCGFSITKKNSMISVVKLVASCTIHCSVSIYIRMRTQIAQQPGKFHFPVSYRGTWDTTFLKCLSVL